MTTMYRSRTENASKYIYSTYASRDVINVDILLQALHKLHREGKGGGGGGGGGGACNCQASN